jgi:uncharacterized protein (UPF0276 family)
MNAPVAALPAAATAQVGIGLRQPHYADWRERRPPLAFVEVHSENFFADGGAAPALLDDLRRTHDLSLHGVGLSLGSACGVDAEHLRRLQRLAERLQPRFVSDHVCFSRAAGLAGTGHRFQHAADLLPVEMSSASLAVLADNIAQVQDALRRPVLVENISAYVQWRPAAGGEALCDAAFDAFMAEPHFLAALARTSGCGLLLDLNNLYVNALNAQGRARAAERDRAAALALARRWLDALAAEPELPVGEIHLAGHSAGGAWVVDDHAAPVCDEVWALYRDALARFGPVPTLIEWDCELPPFDVLLGEADKAARIMLDRPEALDFDGPSASISRAFTA